MFIIHISYVIFIYIDDGIIDSVIYFMAYKYIYIYTLYCCIFCCVDIVLEGDPRDVYLIIPVHKLFQCRFSETIHENPGVFPRQQ